MTGPTKKPTPPKTAPLRCDRCSAVIRSKRLRRLAELGYRAACAKCDREGQR